MEAKVSVEFVPDLGVNNGVDNTWGLSTLPTAPASVGGLHSPISWVATTTMAANPTHLDGRGPGPGLDSVMAHPPLRPALAERAHRSHRPLGDRAADSDTLQAGF